MATKTKQAARSLSSNNDQLPKGWRMVRFGDVVRNVKEKVDRENTDLTRYIAGEHMHSEDIHLRCWGELNGDYLGPAFHRRFRRGQVLYGSRRTYLKKVAVASFDGITANTTFVLETADQEVLLQELLPLIMLTDRFTEHSIRESKGSVNPYINWKDIAKYEFPLPPKDEQCRIAEILWAVDEVVERYRDVESALLLLLDSWATAFLQNDWPITQLENLLEGVQYGSSSRASNDSSTGVPILGIPNVIGGRIDLRAYGQNVE